MSKCEEESVTNATCSNGTILSEYCSPGYSACCRHASPCSHGYGGCVNLQSSKCDSGPVVLGFCENWEGEEPLDVFCCDEDFSPTGFNHKRNEVLTTTFVMIMLSVGYPLLLYIYYMFNEVYIAIMLLSFFKPALIFSQLSLTIVVHVNYGSSISVFASYLLFVMVGLYLWALIYLIESDTFKIGDKARLVLVGGDFCFLLSALLVLYFEVKAQHAMVPYAQDELYGIALLPTDVPTLFPTTQPSVSINPTAACPIGYDQTEYCEPCPVGYYGDKTGCHHCEKWTWTLDSGSAHCDYYTAQRDLNSSYAITLSVIYGVLSLICFAYYAKLTRRWLAVVSVLMITGDQITDILYAQFSIFSNRPLLICSVCFCLFNLVAQGVWIISMFRLRIFIASVTAYNLYLLNSMKSIKGFEYYGYNGNVQHNWVLHEILGAHNITRSLLLCIALIFLDMLWIFLRIIVLVIIIVCMTVMTILVIMYWLLLFVGGIIFSTTKLMSTPQVFESFWKVWNPDFLESNRDLTQSAAVYNLLVGAEMIFENIPQILIQITNSSYQSSWDTLAILSLCFSVTVIASVGNHFRYHLLVQGLSWKEVPKYDILAEMFAVFKSAKVHSEEATNNESQSMP